MSDFTPEDFEKLNGKAPEAPARPRGVWQRFKDSYVEGGLNSPLGAEPVVRARLKSKGFTADEINKAERYLRDDFAKKARVDDEAFKDVDTFSPANIGRRATELVGGALGGIDPTAVIAPGRTIIKKALSQAGINMGVDVLNQGVQIKRKVRDEYNPIETGIAGAGGALLQGVASGAGRVAANRADKARGFVLPVEGRVTSPYGQRSAPKAGASSDHRGTDISARVGTPVKASAEGVVTKVGRGHAKRGNWVEVDYGNGITSRYLHLSGFKVRPGDSVGKGNPFALTGKTGNVTGPHLHWSVYKDGSPIDPATASFGSGARSRVDPGQDVEVAAPRDDMQNPALAAVESARRAENDIEVEAPVVREADEPYVDPFARDNVTAIGTDGLAPEGVGRAIDSSVESPFGQMAPIRDPANDMGGPPIAGAVRNDVGNALEVNDNVPSGFMDRAAQTVKGVLNDEQGSVPREPISGIDKAFNVVKDILNDEEGTFRPFGRDGGSGRSPEGPEGRGPEGPDDVPNKAGNINLDRLKTTKDIDDLLHRTSDDITLQHQTHEETEELANLLGFKSADDLIKHEPKIADLPAYAVNLRNSLVASGKDTVRLARKVSNGDASEKEMAELAGAFLRHAAIQERASNVAGAGGRLLDSFNIEAKGGGEYAKMLKDIPLIGGDPMAIKHLADMISEFADDPKTLAKMARDGVKPRAEDYFFSLWYNMVLSGVSTHAANIFGTSSNLLLDLAQRGISVGLGLPKKLTGRTDRTTSDELIARIYGLVAGAKQGLKNMPAAFESGTPADLAARTEHRSRTFTGKAGGLEYPTRALAAEDEFFRSVASISDYYGMAARQAAEEGLKLRNGLRKNPDYFARLDELIANPSARMDVSAAEYGRRMRFQDEPSALGMGVERLRQAQKQDSKIARGLKAFIRLNVPFLRTIDSLFRTAIRNSPLGVVDSVNIKDFKAGGARRDMAIARVTTGTAITAALVGMANEGLITGAGPTDYKKRDELMASGWRPNSIKVGDKYISYQQLQPYSTHFTTIGTMVERLGEKGFEDKDLTDHVARISLGVADAALESVWIEGMARWFKATEDGPAGIGNWLAGIVASSTVPAIVRQTNQAYIDPVERSTVGDGSISDRITGRVKSAIPGVSDDLPAKVDTYGRVKEREGAIGPDSASPLKVSTEDNDIVVKELQRLSGKEKGALVNPPAKEGLNDRDYEQLKRTSGDIFMSELAFIIEDPEWGLLSKEEQVKIVKKTVKDARKAAREMLGTDADAELKAMAEALES